MRFSVIIPVYNVEKFIGKCLDSVFKQTFSDYEIVAVNDGSTDSSLKILERYQISNSKLKIISQKNKGLGGARNTGISNAKGEFLVFLDSDDYIASNMLETLDYYLSKYKLDILVFDCIQVDLKDNVLKNSTIDQYSDHYTDLTKKQFLSFEPTACTKIYRKSLYTEHFIEFPEKLWYEDLATVFKLIPYTKRIGYLKEALYYYVQQNESITHSSNTYRMLEIIDAINSNVEYFKKIGLWKEYYTELEWNAILHGLYYSALRLFSCGYKRKEINKIFNYVNKTFPTWKSNIYLKEAIESRYLMKEIVNQKYFQIYLKTGFCIKYLNPLSKWIKRMRGKGFVHKK